MGLEGIRYKNNNLGSLGGVGSDHLNPGEQLTPNTSIKSANGLFTFGMGGDGNLWVTDNVRNTVLHNFNIAGRGAVRATMQTDGNFVVYNASNGVIWNSGSRVAGSHLVIQTDGNLVIYAPNNSVQWNLGTNQSASLVNSEYITLEQRSLPALSSATLLQWQAAQRAGYLSAAQQAQLAAFDKASAAALFSGPISFGLPAGSTITKDTQGNLIVHQNPAAEAALATHIDVVGKVALIGANITTLIDRLMTQSTPRYWEIPQLMRSSDDSIYASVLPVVDFSKVVTGRDWWTAEQTQAMIKKALNDYITAVNGLSASDITVSRKDILSTLLYPYVYFTTQYVNLGPFAAAGHSDRHNWGEALWNFDPAAITLNAILPVIQKLGFTTLYGQLQDIIPWMGSTWEGSNTGGKYPSETGYRKLIDEVYRAQSDEAAKSGVFINQVGNFFNQMGTEFWHGVAMPTLGIALLALETSGFQGVTFTIDTIFGTHLTKDIYRLCGALLSGTPLLGKWIQNICNAIGDALDKWAREIHTAVANLFSPGDLNKVRDETLYNQLTSLKTNELVNIEKEHGYVSAATQAWKSDGRDDLVSGFINNIQSRGTSNSNNILASLKIIDESATGGA